MKIAYYSDLHIDMQRKSAPFEVPQEVIEQADVIVIAGDLANCAFKAREWLMTLHSRAVAHSPGTMIMYVPGNHEYYQTNMLLGDLIFQHMNNSLRFFRYLKAGSFVECCGVLFAGDTLWTDFRLHELKGVPERVAKQMAMFGMNDYRRIETDHGGFKLNADDVRDFHDTAILNFMHQFHEYVKFDGKRRKVVMITHHAPSEKSIHAEYENSDLNPCYATGILDKDSPSFNKRFTEIIDVWIHGHCHHTADYDMSDVRVLANPHGYREVDGTIENKDFDSHCMIEI